MKYYGDLNCNRVELMDYYPIDCINNPNTPEGYLNKNGMLLEFIINQQKEKKVPVEYIDCSGFKRKKSKKEYYYSGIKTVTIAGKGETECYVVYHQLPRIANDKTFRWKENAKYSTKETVVIQGNFEFACIVKADGNAFVDVRYAKCDNRHRNRVTITRIEVFDASNEEILKAIEQWKEMFKGEMNDTRAVTRDFRLVS